MYEEIIVCELNMAHIVSTCPAADQCYVRSDVGMVSSPDRMSGGCGMYS